MLLHAQVSGLLRCSTPESWRLLKSALLSPVHSVSQLRELVNTCKELRHAETLGHDMIHASLHRFRDLFRTGICRNSDDDTASDALLYLDASHFPRGCEPSHMGIAQSTKIQSAWPGVSRAQITARKEWSCSALRRLVSVAAQFLIAEPRKPWSIKTSGSPTSISCLICAR